MDNIRLFLWLAVCAIGWLAYSTWLTDYPANGAQTTSQTQSAPAAPATDALPSIDGAPTPAAPPPSEAPNAPGQLVHVRTDVLDVYIDLHGGDLVRADLSTYPIAKHTPDKVVRLLDDNPDTRWVFQSGLRSTAGGEEPNHLATFRSASTDYTLAGSDDELVVALEWAGEGGIRATKTYTFKRGAYAVDLALGATAVDGTAWRGAPYVQMVHAYHPIKRSYTSVDSYSFLGPVLYDGDKYHKLKFDNLVTKPETQKVKAGWFASIQHHFLAAAVPPRDDEVSYTARTAGQDFTLSAVGTVKEVSAATPLDYHYTLFVGPKLQKQLAAAGQELELTVDYGFWTVLSQPLFWLLSHVETLVGNWGLAIVLVTFLIKLAFYKLTATSNRSMAKMRRLQPRMKALQERYKEDRQGLSQATLDLYKKEKVNPAAGCLPMLIQMPFFFAFYWVLVESVEMRQEPFMLWIDDLSAMDGYFVLPVLMAVAMFFQTRLSPPPPDPVQARVMQIVPLVFTAFLAFFPSGLVLYWLTNTVLSILQQWRINTVVAREQAAAGAT